MNIEPKVQIGGTANIVGCDYVQTSYGFNVAHLPSRMNGDFLDYYVHDIEVTISLKTGKVEYRYLLGMSKDFDEKWGCVGWVSGRKIQAADTFKLKSDCIA